MKTERTRILEVLYRRARPRGFFFEAPRYPSLSCWAPSITGVRQDAQTLLAEFGRQEPKRWRGTELRFRRATPADEARRRAREARKEAHRKSEEAHLNHVLRTKCLYCHSRLRFRREGVYVDGVYLGYFGVFCCGRCGARSRDLFVHERILDRGLKLGLTTKRLIVSSLSQAPMQSYWDYTRDRSRSRRAPWSIVRRRIDRWAETVRPDWKVARADDGQIQNSPVEDFQWDHLPKRLLRRYGAYGSRGPYISIAHWSDHMYRRGEIGGKGAERTTDGASSVGPRTSRERN